MHLSHTSSPDFIFHKAEVQHKPRAWEQYTIEQTSTATLTQYCALPLSGVTVVVCLGAEIHNDEILIACCFAAKYSALYFI